ncbi:MAG: hypothetical protein V3V05_10940 [Pontiella sp.]
MNIKIISVSATVIGAIFGGLQLLKSDHPGSVSIPQNSSVVQTSTAIASNGGTAIIGSNINVSEGKSYAPKPVRINLPSIQVEEKPIQFKSKKRASVSNPLLKVNGSSNDIQIKRSSSGKQYQGGNINNSSNELLIYLSDDQYLTIKINGSSNDIIVDRAIAEQINVISSGSNNNVSEI